jgi:hypothetical protein
MLTAVLQWSVALHSYFIFLDSTVDFRYPLLQSRTSCSCSCIYGQSFTASHRAIAACRAIIRLKAFNISKQENIRNNSSLGDRISTPAIGHRSPADPVSFLPSYKTMEPEVHITTERISMNEFGYVLLHVRFE